MSFDDLVLAKVYANPILSTAAVYTPVNGTPVTIRVIDQTDGVLVGNDRKSTAIKAGATVRRGDIATAPTGGAITINGVNYIIESYLPRLNGQGAATGELQLFLKRA